MRILKKLKSIQLITVGTKVLCGVALATNLSIGALVYVNLQSTKTIENTVDEVLTIREHLSANLRETIFNLQSAFLKLPDFFRINPQQTIIEEIQQRYPVTGEKSFEGRSAYKSLFSRRGRRDISKGKVVVTEKAGDLLVSYGLLDEEKNFTETVVQLQLQADNAGKAAEEITTLIETVEQEQGGEGALRNKVLALNAMTADTALEAETTRNEILQHVEDITAKEHLLEEVRQQQKDFTLYMGLLAVFANLVVIFLLVRHIIERPLSSLTTTIDEIQSGNFPEVPRLKRRDQIGVLAEAIRKFRQALLEIRNENERKAREKVIIDGTVQTTTTMIDRIESRAKELVDLSENLQNLAETTGRQAQNVAHNAEDTANNTDRVSESAIHLEEIVTTLNTQVASQTTLVGDIVEKNRTSQSHMEKLDQAVKEIDSIIALVRDITEQTQLLALNATIEAARAGASGKGFSVVATEMKELSTRTQQAASDVLHKVAAINAAGDTLTHNFHEIEGYLDNLNETTSHISEGIELQNSTVATITELAAKTAANTHNVSFTIQEVNEAAGETSTLSRNVHEYADDIAGRLSVLLSETTDKLQQMRDQEPAAENSRAMFQTEKSVEKPGQEKSTAKTKTERNIAGPGLQAPAPVL